jgi:hypothetical protein
MEQKNLHKCFLVKTNNSNSKIEIFFLLGEFDQPETIWSNEMRRLMIERIAVHIGRI